MSKKKAIEAAIARAFDEVWQGEPEHAEKAVGDIACGYAYDGYSVWIHLDVPMVWLPMAAGLEEAMTHAEQRAKLAQLKAVCDALGETRWLLGRDIGYGKDSIWGLEIFETRENGEHNGVVGSFIRHKRQTGAIFAVAARNELPALIEAHLAALDEIADVRGEVEDALGAAGVWANVDCEARTYTDAIEILSGEIKDLQASADLRHKADERAIRQWQAAHPGNDARWPDHADLCVWLMEQNTLLKGTIAADDERLRKAGERVGIEQGCDTAEWMADEIEVLRKQAGERESLADTISVPAEELAGAIRHMRDVVASRDAEIEKLKAAGKELLSGAQCEATMEGGTWHWRSARGVAVHEAIVAAKKAFEEGE